MEMYVILDLRHLLPLQTPRNLCKTCAQGSPDKSQKKIVRKICAGVHLHNSRRKWGRASENVRSQVSRNFRQKLNFSLRPKLHADKKKSQLWTEALDSCRICPAAPNPILGSCWPTCYDQQCAN